MPPGNAPSSVNSLDLMMMLVAGRERTATVSGIRRACESMPLLYRTLIFFWLIGAVARAHALTIELNVTADTSEFFGAGNPAGPAAGAQAHAALRAATAFFESILVDDLVAISPSAGNTWTRRYSHPGTGQFISETNRTVPANTFVLFVGARDLEGGTLARTTEVQTQAQGSQQWQQTVMYRGQTGAPLSDLGPWGGSIAFDLNTAWHFDYTAPLPTNRVDFYSIALHEIAHALGFGSATSWRAKNGVENFQLVFRGPRVLAVYGQGAPLAADHWADDVMSRVFPGGAVQEASMTPALGFGVRRFCTDLDVAALEDMGWKIRPGGAPTLTIVRTPPGQATISWAPATPGFVLQEKTNLTSGNWSNSPSGSTNPITVPATFPTKFYRLFQP